MQVKLLILNTVGRMKVSTFKQSFVNNDNVFYNAIFYQMENSLFSINIKKGIRYLNEKQKEIMTAITSLQSLHCVFLQS